MPISKEGNIQAVDLARTLAILPVLALHASGFLFSGGRSMTDTWDHLQRNGAYGVVMFFVISGFLITRVIDRQKPGLFKPSWKGFYARRLGRILPLFLLDILLGLALALLLPKDSPLYRYCLALPAHPAEPTFWIPLLLFTFNWARAYWALLVWVSVGVHWAVLWSLAVEEQFYLFYPLALRVLGQTRNLLLFLAVLTLAGISWRWFVFLQPLDNGLDWKWGTFGYLDQIAFGIGLYLLQKRWGAWFRKRLVPASAVSACGLAGLGLTYWHTSCGRLLDLFYAPGLIEIFTVLFLLGAMNLSFFESRFLGILALPGRYSYGSYLFHGMLLFFLGGRLLDVPIVPAFLLFLSAVTGTAALSFHFFETPVNRWIRKALDAG